MSCLEKMNCRFELIIPLKFDSDNVADNLNSLEPILTEIKLSKSNQLSGSILLDEMYSPIYAIYALKQEVRTALGIHNDESHRYKYISENIEFRIKKIKLWLFKNGISFITINISINQASRDKVLNFVSYLSNVNIQKEKKKDIIYEQSINTDKKVVNSFNIKMIIKRFLELPNMDFLHPYHNDTYNKTRCLFYGSDFFESNEKRFEFLEMLRLQSKSSMYVSHGVDKLYLYEPRSYLSWAVSPYVLCGVSDLESCGEKNVKFLTDEGGLKQSVVNNYLPIYLNGMSVKLALDDIQKSNNAYTYEALKSLPAEIKKKLYSLHNTKIYDLTELEEPINKLFREYVCNNALKIPEIFALLKSSEIFDQIDDKLEELKIEQNKIFREIHSLTWFVKENLAQYIKAQKQELIEVMERGFENNEKRISETCHNISGYINKYIGSSSSELLENQEKYLKSIFGRIWDMLMEETRISLISAGVLWKMCENIKGEFDYSGICIAVTSALETELKQYFFIGFQKYLEDTYGAPSEYKWKETFNNWPEILLSTSKKKYNNDWKDYKCTGKNKPCIRKKDGEYFTLGMMPYIFGINKERDTSKEQIELLTNRLNEYLSTFMITKPDMECIDTFISGGKGDTFIDKFEQIRKEYRNKAAHGDNIISEAQAKGCYHEIVGKIESFHYTNDITGILLKLFQYIR